MSAGKSGSHFPSSAWARDSSNYDLYPDEGADEISNLTLEERQMFNEFDVLLTASRNAPSSVRRSQPSPTDFATLPTKALQLKCSVQSL